jgi:protein transport protein SEC24
MAQPQGDPAQVYAAQDPTQEQHDGQAVQQEPAAGAPGSKKKRQYAGQAYEFGGNTVQGGGPAFAAQQPGGYDYHHGAPAQTYGGDYQATHPVHPTTYDQQQAYGQQGYPAQQSPQQMPGAQVGYQPNSGYPAPPDMQGATQAMGQMNIAPQSAPQQRQQLNPLYPSDLLSQPFQVSELEIPPPAIIIPPNVSTNITFSEHS